MFASFDDINLCSNAPFVWWFLISSCKEVTPPFIANRTAEVHTRGKGKLCLIVWPHCYIRTMGHVHTNLYVQSMCLLQTFLCAAVFFMLSVAFFLSFVFYLKHHKLFLEGFPPETPAYYCCCGLIHLPFQHCNWWFTENRFWMYINHTGTLELIGLIGTVWTQIRKVAVTNMIIA